MNKRPKGMRPGAPEDLGTYEWDPEVIRQAIEYDSKGETAEAMWLLLWEAGYHQGTIKRFCRGDGLHAEALRILLAMRVVALFLAVRG